MKYAIVRLGGKQFKVKTGDLLEIERQKSPINFEVLTLGDTDSVLVGAPVLGHVLVKAKIIEQKKGPKILISRFKPKSRYNKTSGHRQPISVIRIEEILVDGKSIDTEVVAKKAEKPVVAKKVAAKKATAKETTVKKTAVKKTTTRKVSKEVTK